MQHHPAPRGSPLCPARWRIAILTVVVGGVVALAHAAPDSGLHHPNALLINVTESDLNRILRDSFRSNGGPWFEGHRPDVSRGLEDLHYRASLSEPVLELRDDLSANLNLDILEAELRIGRVERKLLARRTSCEGLGLVVERERPVDIDVHLRFALEQGDLRLVPQSVSLDGVREGFRLIKPTRCRNSPLPKWLLWALGKPHLRRKLSELDEVLLGRARDLADELVEDGGFLRRAWDTGAADGPARLWLYPDFVDSREGSLLVGLAVSSHAEPRTAELSLEPFADRGTRSFVAVSERFLNAALELAFDELDADERRPSGNLARVFRGRSVYALVPGLRTVGSLDDVSFTIGLGRSPTVAFRPQVVAGQRERATIGVRLSGLALHVWQELPDGERLLGTLRVDHADLRLLPYRNVLGGVSFDVLDNDWSVSSEGLEFNEQVFAAMLQELLFGEIFETRYHPLARAGLDVGHTGFQPTYFDLVAGYLLIDLGP